MLGSNRAQAIAAPATTTQTTTETSTQPQSVSVAQQAQVVTRLRQAIRFNIRATCHWQVVGNHHCTPSNHVERHTRSVGFLRWDKRLWHGRWISAKQYVRDNPWINMLRRTLAFRLCVIGHESAMAGRYKAENGGTRYVEGPGYSDASGAYQFLDSTWQSRLAAAKRYFRGKLKGWWSHAADAPPKTQDIVAAYTIMADGGSDWAHPDCHAIGVAPA